MDPDASTVTRFSPYFETSATASASSATFTGDPLYPVFPNSNYLSRFAVVTSDKAGLTDLDLFLYDMCYLPARPHSDPNSKRGESWYRVKIEKLEYNEDQAPCKRQSSINANCYFQNTNGTFSGLRRYEDNFGEQQKCFCEKYPFFDSSLGCQKCFEMHGGIEGTHWFPETFVSAAANAYCGQDPPTKEFYKFVQDWKETAAEARIPSTTAENVLGTQTAASLYYTPNAAVESLKATSVASPSPRRTTKTMLATALVGLVLVSGLMI